MGVAAEEEEGADCGGGELGAGVAAEEGGEEGGRGGGVGEEEGPREVEGVGVDEVVYVGGEIGGG